MDDLLSVCTAGVNSKKVSQSLKCALNSPSWPPTGEVSEAALVRDILFVFQGIDGKFIKMSTQDNCYKIDSKVHEHTSIPGEL